MKIDQVHQTIYHTLGIPPDTQKRPFYTTPDGKGEYIPELQEGSSRIAKAQLFLASCHPACSFFPADLRRLNTRGLTLIKNDISSAPHHATKLSMDFRLVGQVNARCNSLRGHHCLILGINVTMIYLFDKQRCQPYVTIKPYYVVFVD